MNPKRSKLKEAIGDLDRAEGTLQEKKDNLKQIETMIQGLTDQLSKAQAEKESLEFNLEKNKRQLKAAEKLLLGLANEKISWDQRIQKLIQDSSNIVGDIMITSAIIAYFGVFPIVFRDKMLEQFKQELVN